MYVRVARNKRESGALAVINRARGGFNAPLGRELYFEGHFERFFALPFFSRGRLLHGSPSLGGNQFEISHRARKSIRFTSYP